MREKLHCILREIVNVSLSHYANNCEENDANLRKHFSCKH